MLLCAWFLATLDFRHMEALLQYGVLELGCLKIGMEFLIGGRCECIWWVSHGSQIPVPVDITPDRACGATLLGEECENFDGFRLIHYTERAICLVDIGAPRARIVLSEVISQSMQLPVILSFKSVGATRSNRLSRQESVYVLNNLILLLRTILIRAYIICSDGFLLHTMYFYC